MWTLKSQVGVDMPPDSSRPGREAWDFFASVRLAIVVLILVAAASLLGTLIPQGQPPNHYLAHYSPGLAKFILAASLDRVYQSFWFLGLLALLAVNLIVCSLNRLKKTWRLVFESPTPQDIRMPNLRLKKTIEAPLPPEETFEAVRAVMGRLGAVVASPSGASPRILFAQSGRLSRLGAYIIHLSILIFFAGGLASAAWEIKAFVTIFEGQSIDRVTLRSGEIMPLGFEVKLDRFVFETYPNGAPKLFRSDLSFIKDGRVVEQAQVVVNGPAKFGRMTFYQSSYGRSLGQWVELGVLTPNSAEKTVRLSVEGENDLPGVGRLAVVGFSPDLRGIGPGVKLRFTPRGETRSEVFWVITRPPYQMRRPSPELFRLIGFEGRYYSGLQANYDPGVWFVWVGGSLMVIGLGAAFFLSHRRLWAEVRPAGGGARIILAGNTNRNRPAFERRFEGLCARLERLVKKPGPEEKR